MLCLCLVEEILDEEEFVLLYDIYGRNSEFRHSAFVQGVCYFFPHTASLCSIDPFLVV